MKRVIVASFTLLVIDLVIKSLVMNLMYIHQKITVIPNFFHIFYVRNDGAAFSLFEGQQTWLILIALGVLTYIIYTIKKEKHFTKMNILLYGMLIAGITSNLIDRVLFGEVIDYLSFTIMGYGFPVFNLADTMIVLSLTLYLLYSFKEAA